ncbi:MAG: hydrogenase maturation nickel metallochaperone HypA [Chloroflexota bacterium]
MHELDVTQSILSIALENARKVDAKQITGINLLIGQMASLVDDSIQFYWDIISEGTIALGAKLNFKRIPTEMRCFDCGILFFPNSETFDCPSCGSIRVQVIHGDEMRVDSIDVE